MGRISLDGIRVADDGPVDELFLPIARGVTVLYGKNGAGKSRILRALTDVLLPRATKAGARNLYFREDIPSEWGVGTFGPRRRPWQELSAYADERNITSRPPDWFIDILNAADCEAVAVMALAMGLYCGVDKPEELQALIEVAAQRRFSLNVDQDGSHLAVAGIPDELTPRLRHICAEVTRELQESCFQDPQRYRHKAWYYLNLTGDSDWNMADGMRSAAYAAAGLDVGPAWCADQFFELSSDWRSSPARVVLEGDTDLYELTFRRIYLFLRDEWNAAHPELDARRAELRAAACMGGDEAIEALKQLVDFDREMGTPDLSLLEDGPSGGLTISTGAHRAISELERRANTIFASLLLEAPPLVLELRRPQDWVHGPALAWQAMDPTGNLVSLADLSTAQRRWAWMAVQLGLSVDDEDDRPLVLVLDEPELALHRRAESHLAKGLVSLAHSLDASIVVATHSPALLKHPETSLFRVFRASNGSTQVGALPRDYKSRLDDLGFDVADLLQFCRVVLLVEGEHDKVVFERLFGDSLARHGIDVIAARGAKNLASVADAQILFRFTEVRLVALVDNDAHERVAGIWSEALKASSPEDAISALSRLSKERKTAEGKFLAEFGAAVLRQGLGERVTITALQRGDIIEYLPTEVLVPRRQEWGSLREAHRKGASGLAFKDWLIREFGADFDPRTVDAAAARVDRIDPDLTRVVQICIDASR